MTIGFSQSRMKPGTRRAITHVSLAAGLLAAASCGRSRPVATLAVYPVTLNLGPSGVTPLTLRWNPTGPLDGLQGKPRVFVHVLDGGRRLLRTFDHPLPESWTPGRAQRYEIELYQSVIGDPLPPGAYEMTFGLYDDGGKKRWPLVVDGEEVGRNEYRLASLVAEAAAAAPSFEFRGPWAPVEPGSSKQVIARRCLSAGGSIAVVGAPSPGTVRVAVSVDTKGIAAGSRGAWRVSASCSPETLEVSSSDLRWVGFSVTGAAGNPACEIRFEPPASAGGSPAQSLCLEVLAWRPGAPGPR